MLLFLAQTSSAPATTAAALVESARAPAWTISLDDIIRATAVFAGTAIFLALLMFPLRRLLRSARLVAPYIMVLAAASLLHAIMVLPGPDGRPMLHSDNVVAYWSTRVFAAVMVYACLRVIDSLIVTPLLTRRGKSPMPRFLRQIIIGVLVVFAVLIFGSSAFGWDIDKFLAGSAIVSIVLGLALQESLGNFFSGLVMQASPPFSVGHRIKCAGFEGDVVDMNWRAVTLQTDVGKKPGSEQSPDNIGINLFLNGRTDADRGP